MLTFHWVQKFVNKLWIIFFITESEEEFIKIMMLALYNTKNEKNDLFPMGERMYFTVKSILGLRFP